MSLDEWCLVCCTRHAPTEACPGELSATGRERHGWRVNVETDRGVEAFGVLVAECETGLWRARILTYPRILWVVPGGRGTLKFAGRTPQDAELQAVNFIRRHCRERGFVLREDQPAVLPGRFDAEAVAQRLGAPTEQPAQRKIRFLPVRYGSQGLTEKGRTANLSETGLFVISDIPVTSGSWLNLLLSLDDRESLGLRGMVRWKADQPSKGRAPGMGIQLDRPPVRYLDYVRELP